MSGNQSSDADTVKSSGGVDASATSPPVPLPEKAGVMHPVPHGRAAVAGARRACSEPSICVAVILSR